MLHLPELDGQGPLYWQLSRALTVVLGESRNGERLPATRELAGQLGVSRNTVRAAYDLLQSEGLLNGRRGSGNFVAASAPAGAPAAPRSGTVAPQSAFARRSREGAPGASRLRRPRDDLRFNLQYGEPLTDVRFAETWRRELGRAAVRASLGYPDSQGLPVLREALSSYLRRRRLVVAPEDVLVVSGMQQALSLAARVLLDKGDSVVLENPCYFYARELMHAYGARINTVDVDHLGLLTHRLPARSPKLVCVTPSHQFPLGVVLSPVRRRALLDYAREHHCWVLEDDYDAEFRFDGRHVPPLRAQDLDDRVIHVGSFSKILAPSLRLAYVVMPRALRRDFVVTKRLEDMGCPSIEQAALANFLTSAGIDRHLRRVSKTLRERREALLAGLERHVGKRLRVVDSGAGMHVVGRLPRGSFARESALVEAAREVGLSLHPLSAHYLRSRPQFGLLLGYASLAPLQIDAACELLGRCLDRV